jgi:hypothetical protein
VTEIYIEALLANEMLADQIWEEWQRGVITNDQAAAAWILVTDSQSTAEVPVRGSSSIAQRNSFV